MKDTNQRIALTKRLLREGLLRLLKTKPLDKINITELCKESGINRATFYRHYELPRDILTEMQAEFVEEMIDNFNKPLTEKDVESFFDYLHQNAALVKLFMKYNSDVDLIRIFNNFYPNIFEKKALKFFDAEDSQLFYAFLAGGVYFLLRQWLMEDIKKTPKEIASIALSIVNKENIFQ